MHLAQDAAADALLERDPLALLMGMLLDQQQPMERAFAGPARLLERLGGDVARDRLDARAIAQHEPESFKDLVASPPAVHRFPGSMAERLQALAGVLVADYGGDAAAVWAPAAAGEEDGAALLRRLQSLPGFGPQKAKVMLALLGKQCGVRPEGWREAAGDYGEEGSTRSVADVVDQASLLAVRETKRLAKARARESAGGR